MSVAYMNGWNETPVEVAVLSDQADDGRYVCIDFKQVVSEDMAESIFSTDGDRLLYGFGLTPEQARDFAMRLLATADEAPVA